MKMQCIRNIAVQFFGNLNLFHSKFLRGYHFYFVRIGFRAHSDLRKKSSFYLWGRFLFVICDLGWRPDI